MANKITTILDLDGRGFDKSIKSIRREIAETDGSLNKFKAGAKGAFEGLKQYGTEAAFAAGAALIAFGAKSVAAFNDLALEAGRMGEALGVPVEEMSKLIEVAGDLGIESGTLEKVLGRMNQTAGQSPDAFKAIGAEIVKTQSGATDVNATFLATIDALNRIDDPARRAAAAQQIFGRSWRDSAELIGLSSKQITDAMGDVSDAKIINDDEVKKARDYRAAMDALSDSIEDLMLNVGSTLTPAITTAAETTDNARNAFSELDDALGPVDEALTDVAKANWEYLNPVGQAINLLGVFSDSNDEAAESLTSQSGALVQASIDAAFLDKATADLADQQEDAAKSAEDQARALEQTQRSIRAAQDAVNDLMSAQLAAIDSNLGYRNAQAAAAEAVLAYDEAAGDAKTTTVELDTAARDAEGAVLAQAAAAVQLAEDQAAANGSSLTAIEKNQLYRAELETLVGYTTGPLKAAIEDYIATLGRIPSSVSTSIGVGGRGPTTSVNGYRASGGPVSAGGTYVVGEEGPELLQMGSTGGNVIPNGATVGGGQTVVNVTVNGGDPNTIIAAIRKYVRTNGPVTGIT